MRPVEEGQQVGLEKLVAPRFGIATQAVYAGVIGSFLYGYMLCYLNSCGDLIAIHFQWCNSNWQANCLASRTASGLINAFLYLGAAAGALLAGRPFMVSYGSRRQLIISDVLFGAGGVLGAGAIGLQSLLLSRLFSGVGLGISAIAAPVYIAEVSPSESRGFHSAKHGLFIAVGLLAAELIGLPQSPAPAHEGDVLTALDDCYWRWIMGFPLLLALLQAFLLGWGVPIDTVPFLVKCRNRAEARELLYRTYGLPSPKANSTAGVRPELELCLDELTTASAEAKSRKRITIAQAVHDSYWRGPLIIGFFLASYQQLTGINALMAYSNGLFAQAGIPPHYLELASVGMCIANVGVSILSTKLVDSWGRRTLLLWGASFQTLAMAAMVYLVQYMPPSLRGLSAFVFFSLFVVSWNFGLGAITWLWLSEIYPMEIRGPALSACGVVKWLSCFCVVFCARFLDLSSSCIVFGTVSGVGYVGMWLWVLETKGCSMEDSPMTPRSGRSTPRSGRSGSAMPRSGPNTPTTEYHMLPDASSESESDDGVAENTSGR